MVSMLEHINSCPIIGTYGCGVRNNKEERLNKIYNRFPLVLVNVFKCLTNKTVYIYIIPIRRFLFTKPYLKSNVGIFTIYLPLQQYNQYY